MVIQRIQTLWLFLAIIFMIVTGIRPFLWVGETPYYLTSFPILAILNWLTVLLLVICIFTFKNLKLQKTISLISLLMMVALAITGFVIQARLLPEAYPEWIGGVLFLTGAAICDAFAFRGMHRDQKKLRNADRLWS